MKKQFIASLLVVLALLAGCAQPPAETPTPTHTPTPALSPTATPKLTVSPSPTLTPKPSPTPTPKPEVLKVVGQIGGPTQAVAVQGNYAYVGVGLRLIVLEIADPASPSEVGATEPFGWYVEDVAVVGSTAFVAAGGAGLYILDVSNPARPAVVGSLNTPGYTENVAVVGKYAYVADGPAGLRVVDIGELARPAEMGQAYTSNYAFDVAVEGRYAYVAGAGAGLLVADVSDPAKPREVGSLDTPGYAYGLTPSESTVYIADGWGGLRIADVSDPGKPKELGGFETLGWALDVRVDGDMAYVAGATYGLRILDISDKNKPEEIGGYETSGGNAVKLAVSRGKVYLADRSTGLGIFDVSVPTKPIRLGFYSPMGYADAVAVSGSYAYVAAGPYGLRVVDISDLSNPREVGVYETQAYATSIVISKNYAYVGTYSTSESSSGLHVVDIANPTRPNRATFDAIHGQPQDLIVDGRFLYIADEFGLQVWDLTDPASPVQAGAIDFAQGDEAKATLATSGVDVSGNMAYVTHADRLAVLEVSNPQEPIVVASYRPPDSVKSGAVTIAGNFAYVTMVPGLQVVDISNPKNPKGVGSYNLEAPERLAFANDTVYVAGSGAGLLALDVSSPQKPTRAGLQRLPGYAIGLTAAGKHIYVADGEGGLFIVEDVRKEGAGQQATSAQSGIPTEGKPDVARLTTSAESKEQPAAQPKSGDYEGDGISKPTAYFSSGRIITVTSTADSDQGTLRWALENAASGDTITFDPKMFPPKNPTTIRLTSGLFLSGKQSSVTVDASNAGVILDGSATLDRATGFHIFSDYNVIKGLQVLNFAGNGIQLSGANNIVGGIGTGGTGLGEGNLISGNGYAGVMIMGSEATGNRVIGNYIGTDLSGKGVLGNRQTGVFLSHGASQNIIGGATEAERNVISGNARTEVSLMSRANGNKVIGNYIGTDAGGRTSLGNPAMASVSIELGGFSNVIERNVISNGNHIGVIISDWGSWYNEVIGNFMGVDATGSASLGGTGAGVHVNASFNKVGGSSTGERNIISGNADQGVKVGMGGTTDVLVLGNYIGTDVFGTKAIGNGVGVSIGEGTHRTVIGGSTNSERNLISGNNGSGVIIRSIGTDHNFVTGNYIGTDVAGNAALSNRGNGIEINAGNQNFVLGNVIVYNKGGITVKPGEHNRIHHNSVIETGKSGDAGNNNRWDDGQQGNYWSDYKGKDENSDGVGDTPHPVPPNGVDRYPLIKPDDALRLGSPQLSAGGKKVSP